MKSDSCRIIGGRWRGRKIRFDDAKGLRPTTDRIRETVFNWLQPYVVQSHCLDCFAGSGVLGFEALSRGANDVVFLEQNRNTVKKLRENATELKTDSVSIHHGDALDWIKSAGMQHAPFDLVFLDPPFHSDLLEQSCVSLGKSSVLSADAIIYVEHDAGKQIAALDDWYCLKQKISGQVSYALYHTGSLDDNK